MSGASVGYVGQIMARATERRSQRKIREEKRLSGADVRVGRNQQVLGSLDIGTALEERRR